MFVLSNLSVKQKFLVSVSFIGVVFLLVFLCVVWQFDKIQGVEKMLQTRMHTRLDLILDIEKRLGWNGLVDGLHKYLFTGDKKFLQQSQSAYRELHKLISDYMALKDLMPGEKNTLGEFEKRLTMLDPLLRKGVNVSNEVLENMLSRLDIPLRLLEDAHENVEAVLEKKLEKVLHRSVVTVVLVLVCAIFLLMVVFILLYFDIVPMLVLISRVLFEIGEGNFSVPVPKVNRKDELGKILFNLKKAVNKVGTVLSDISSATAEVVFTTSSLDISKSELKGISSSQHSQAQQIATAAEEMSQTVSEIAQNATRSAESARIARDIAIDGKNSARLAVQTMGKVNETTSGLAKMIERLNKKVSEIDEIVMVISDIADQTSLLSLNAAIEAARAGEQGRGFAVVADEVKKLAERTIIATKEISEKIISVQKEAEVTTKTMHQSIEEVNEATEEINKVGEFLEKIVESVEMVDNQIAHIATAVEEEAQVSEEIVRNIENSLELAQKVENIAGIVASQVGGLKKVVDSLREAIGSVKSNAIFDLVKIDHLVWLAHIEAHIKGEIQMTEESLKDYKHCRLGRWYYYGEGSKYYSNIRGYKDLETPHMEVHNLGREIILTYNQGQHNLAWQKFEELKTKAQQLLSIIDNMKQECLTCDE